MANEIFYFDNTDAGAPTLNNTAGALIAVLDACLLNGFNVKTITINVSAGVATCSGAGHGFSSAVGKLLLVAGATPAGLNGLKQPTVIDANTFTFPALGVADGAATGTITAKRAPVGNGNWSKAFTGTNKAAYKSVDPQATGRYLRVDDIAGSDARVVMYESMTDIDTGVGPAPTAAQSAGGGYWGKGASDATAKLWVVCGDSRAFYLFTHAGGGGLSTVYPFFFGDINTYRAADAYHCYLAHSTGAIGNVSSGVTGISLQSQIGTPPSTAGVISRLSNQIAQSVTGGISGLAVSANAVWGANGHPAYPSPVDNGMMFHRPVYVVEGNANFGNPVRGELPGFVQMIANLAFAHRDVISGIDGMTGSLLVVAIQSSSNGGRFALDVTGPWR